MAICRFSFVSARGRPRPSRLRRSARSLHTGQDGSLESRSMVVDYRVGLTERAGLLLAERRRDFRFSARSRSPFD